MNDNLAMKALLSIRGTLLSLGASKNDLKLVDALIEREKKNNNSKE